MDDIPMSVGEDEEYPGWVNVQGREVNGKVV